MNDKHLGFQKIDVKSIVISIFFTIFILLALCILLYFVVSALI